MKNRETKESSPSRKKEEKQQITTQLKEGN
jgi:hypothetical protein